MEAEMKLMMVGTSKMRSEVLPSWAVSPLMRTERLVLKGSISVLIKGPRGPKVSEPLARHHWRSPRCQGRQLTSLPAADDDNEFTFVLDEAGVFGEDDGALGVEEGGEGLEEDAGDLGLLSAAEMAGVVEADGEDLGWLAGHEELYIGEVVSGGCCLDVAVDVAFDLGNGAVFDYSVGCSAGGLESSEFHVCVSGVFWVGVGGWDILHGVG